MANTEEFPTPVTAKTVKTIKNAFPPEVGGQLQFDAHKRAVDLGDGGWHRDYENDGLYSVYLKVPPGSEQTNGWDEEGDQYSYNITTRRTVQVYQNIVHKLVAEGLVDPQCSHPQRYARSGILGSWNTDSKNYNSEDKALFFLSFCHTDESSLKKAGTIVKDMLLQAKEEDNKTKALLSKALNGGATVRSDTPCGVIVSVYRSDDSETMYTLIHEGVISARAVGDRSKYFIESVDSQRLTDFIADRKASAKTLPGR